MYCCSVVTDTERVMHKLKKPVEEDLFVYEASVVNCWCDLRATRSVRPSDLERYFGCPREREVKKGFEFNFIHFSSYQNPLRLISDL